MKFTPVKLNAFLFFKLPSAYWSGVRVKTILPDICEVCVRHKWFNQNPFKSMYFATQAMAAELTTGALVMYYIKSSGKNISMLVTQNSSEFSKKATGKITFVCNEGHLVKEAIQNAIDTKQGQTLWLTSVGKNENNEIVSTMKFMWSIKVK